MLRIFIILSITISNAQELTGILSEVVVDEKNIHIWDRNGKTSQILETNIQNLKWTKEKPVAFEKKESILKEETIYIPFYKEDLKLVTLNNNRFALFNKKGDLVKGDPEDFIKVYKTNNDQVIIETFF